MFKTCCKFTVVDQSDLLYNLKIQKLCLNHGKIKQKAIGKLKQKWGELTDDDLDYQEGKEDEVVGRIQKKTGETKENVNSFLNDLKF